ncbi:MAG: PHD finger domain-containing protein [Planctomycetota bacterium]
MRARPREGGPRTCPLCRDRLSRGTVQTCSGCGAAQHAECARELNLGCGTLGCAKAGPRRQVRAAPDLRPQLELPRAVNGAHYVLLFLAGLTLMAAPFALAVLGVLELARDPASGLGMLGAAAAIGVVLLRQLGSGLPVVRVELGERVARLGTGSGAWLRFRYRLGRRDAAEARGRLQSPWSMSRVQRRPVYYLQAGGWFGRRFVVDDPEAGHALVEQLRAWGAGGKAPPEKGT